MKYATYSGTMEYTDEFIKIRSFYFYLVDLGLHEAAHIVYETVEDCLLNISIAERNKNDYV